MSAERRPSQQLMLYSDVYVQGDLTMLVWVYKDVRYYPLYISWCSTTHTHPPFNRWCSTNHTHPPFTRWCSTNHTHPPFNQWCSTNHTHTPFKRWCSSNHTHTHTHTFFNLHIHKNRCCANLSINDNYFYEYIRDDV